MFDLLDKNYFKIYQIDDLSVSFALRISKIAQEKYGNE